MIVPSCSRDFVTTGGYPGVADADPMYASRFGEGWTCIGSFTRFGGYSTDVWLSDAGVIGFVNNGRRDPSTYALSSLSISIGEGSLMSQHWLGPLTELLGKLGVEYKL